MAEILVAWWGTYSSGGSEGTDPHIAWVREGADREIELYIEDNLLYGAGESEHSEHWRGVEFRRLSTAEVATWREKRATESLTGFFMTVLSMEEGELKGLIWALGEVSPTLRKGIIKAKKAFAEVPVD